MKAKTGLLRLTKALAAFVHMQRMDVAEDSD